MIPYARQSINEADIDAVVEVLRSDFITQGATVPCFEEAVAQCCGAQHAVAVNSATSALHLACAALGVGPGDVVWTSPISFVASANCARYCGAEIDFVDIDPRTWCLSAEALEIKLEETLVAGRRLPKVVIPVHFGGQSCDMAKIAVLAANYGFRVIEDASHALGGKYKNEPVGSCAFSDVAVFSFHPVKIVTTGEGGVAVSNDPCLIARMARLRSHGITRNVSEMTREADGPWYYEQLELGFNYRMTDFAGALGLSQLRRLDAFVARRNELARQYEEALGDLPVEQQIVPGDVLSARHLYVIRVPTDLRLGIFTALRADGIGVNVHYIPIHLQPYYRRQGFAVGQFPMAEAHYHKAISLPLFAGMSGREQEAVVKAVRKMAC